jgi:hypothetical protein
LGSGCLGSILTGSFATTRRQTYSTLRAPSVKEADRRVNTEEPGRESNPQPFDLGHHETIAELRALPDAELERRHDAAERTVANTKEAAERLLYIERAPLPH